MAELIFSSMVLHLYFFESAALQPHLSDQKGHRPALATG
jgi:hypothetical protein